MGPGTATAREATAPVVSSTRPAKAGSHENLSLSHDALRNDITPSGCQGRLTVRGPDRAQEGISQAVPGTRGSRARGCMRAVPPSQEADWHPLQERNPRDRGAREMEGQGEGTTQRRHGHVPRKIQRQSPGHRRGLHRVDPPVHAASKDWVRIHKERSRAESSSDMDGTRKTASWCNHGGPSSGNRSAPGEKYFPKCYVRARLVIVFVPQPSHAAASGPNDTLRWVSS